ncbi:MAG: GFA family protein [Betaproteobacteria bacterium]
MSNPHPTFEGACHCGAIGYVYRTAMDPESWNVRACQCSFCRAHAVRTTSDPAGSVQFRERVRGTLHHYRFGQMTADYLVCRKCGVYIGAEISAPEGRYGIVNINALQPVPARLPEAVAAVYEAETAEQRIARRRERWTPVSPV